MSKLSSPLCRVGRKKLIKDKLIKKGTDVTENTSSKFEGVEKKILDEINKN